ncbi:Dynein heavy chain 17, axonemal [Collichthys lucidus]|uniref:Dynein heavy chain 17, axonemal n=1 Tax=Collichthys lucidus TaxID=240159 RepID=A0A4U5V3X6_COLLU|nr:Dynein heavy chain 17, axonemal [Collichthys lucidus]
MAVAKRRNAEPPPGLYSSWLTLVCRQLKTNTKLKNIMADMSDDESVPCFLEDVRIKFVEGKVCELLRLHRQTWEKTAVSEEFQTLLKDFFEKESIIFFSSSKKGCLVAYNEAPSVAQDKQIYMLKKTVIPINAENYRELLLFGFLSPSPLLQLSSTIRAETQVINWTNLIQKILKEDSSDLLMAGCNPGPNEELKFWASRTSNIQNINHQLQSPIVQKMAQMLEMMDSSYHPTIKALIGNVFDAFQEAQDIDLHLQPLHAQLSQLEKEGFPHLETLIPALFHTLFLIWTNCQSYQRPARIVVLLQELCNLFIEQASAYLSADLLLREDPEESLQMVKSVIQVFRCFRDSYQTQRERLANHVKHAPWDFPSAMIFTRFNQFFNRMLQLEDFEIEYKDFKVRIGDFECRLASLLCLAFKDCSGLESAFKMESGLTKNVAHTSGALKWAKMLRERIQTPWEKIKLLFDMPTGGLQMVQENYMYVEMLSLLDQYEEDIYSDWCNGLEQACLINLNQPLLSRHATSGLISVNFNTKYVSSLQLVVQWYNRLKQTVLGVELPLIRTELESIDVQLTRAECDLTWQDPDCWSFISTTKNLVHDLVCRVSRVKENCEAIQSMMKGWTKQAMFCRKDNKKGSLIQLEDREDCVSKKYSSMKKDGDTIHKLVQTTWNCWPNQTPLFEAQLMLTSSGMVFFPSLELDAGDGLYELIEGLVGDIFKTSVNINRVAAHLRTETYQEVMDDMLDLLDLRQEIMERVETVLKKAINYQRKFDCYTHLWQDDRAEFLSQFLLYGRVPTAEEMEAYGVDTLPESLPTIDTFKEQIDYYEDLYAEISKLEGFRVFNGWFRVDIKFFKVSLLNTLKKWSWLFKEHLLTYVTNSLDELQKFVQATVEGLGLPVAKANHRGLVEVMSHLLAVRDRQAATDSMFEPLRDTVILLEQYGVTIPEQVYSQLEELPEKWSGAKKLALKVRHEVAPMQNAEVMVLRRQCMAFEVKQGKFREMFKAMAPFSYNAVHPYTSLEKSEKAIRGMEKEVAELQESTNLFDVTIPDYRDIKLCRREITVLKELWDMVVFVQSSVENWTMTKWRQINVDQMDAELRRFAKDIRKLDKEARAWDVYSGLDLYVKNLLTSLRAVSQLQNLAIRERHWMQLIRATQMDFTVTDSTTLEDLLALQLHLLEDEIRNIVDKAVKEMAIEKVVTQINQMWASMELSYEDHYQTSVPLLKCDEELIETLEDHQVQLQGIFQSKHVDHFMFQVVELQKQLTVADSVLMVWMEVQRTWAYLESIFKGCDDICQQLPADAHRFQAIDAEFQELMLDSAKTKNVIEATNKPCLFEKLEDLQKSIYPVTLFHNVMCHNEMTQCFLQVAVHLSKLFDNMSDLEFARNEHLDNPKLAVGMYSKEREYVPFQTECRCYGPISQLNLLIGMLLGELSSGDRQKIMTICTIDVHARDIVASLIAQKVTTSQAFQWLSQLRHCWYEQQHHCFVNICDAQFLYSYEYLGNTPRLVITPLTDRCYITLTQSLHLTMSGAPAGPAGTGKTETTKDLGRAMGVMVYIFNCSEQMDYKSIGNIYKGLAQTGAWGCFDEFNRIAVDVLSVVAVQVKTIQDAIRTKKKRPCAMVVPDTELICEIMLVAEGFHGAKLLARKFITLYTLCKELLSKQDHYDWGLRAVKSVLVVAGALRRRDKRRPEDQILRVLHKTYVNLKRKPVWNDLNPKAVDRDELFGFIHPATREWKDGLFSSVMREQANISHTGPKWIVLDGDIDPMWIESLNTVMDDNKVLTLASNERVPLTSSMRLVFEISHLRTATPATVSRAGILYVNQQDLGWNPYVASWIDQRKRQTERAHLTILFEKYVPHCLEQMRNTFKTITPIPENSMVQTLCTLLDCLLTPENIPSDSPRELYETYFTFACIWAFGGALCRDQLYDYQVEFSQWWTKEMKTVKLPAQGIVFDYYLDPQTRRFLPWGDTVPLFEMETCTPLQAVLVHTAETVRLRYFMDLLLERRQPLMLVGNAGVGKTALVRNKLDCLPESFMTAKVPFNYYTTSLMLQVILERPLEKRAGRSYSPVGNRRMVYFIDDMNMPAVDSYGTVQPHTLIRQHLDYQHWYDRQKLTLKEIHNTQYVACMNPTAGSFNINPRLQGILFAGPESVKESTDLALLWLHESCRVYSDRLVDVMDLQLFRKLQMETVHECFEGLEDKKVTKQPLLYCHFAQIGDEASYTPVTDWSTIRSILTDALESYNELNAAMNLVLFEDAMQHVCRISRILESPRSHGLLVGVGGSGKQSLTRLAAYISSVEVFQITLSKGYSIQDLKMDLAGLFLKTGVKNQRVALLLTDAQIPDEAVSGEIPELFSEEEIEEIVTGVRAEVRALGLLDSRENCWRIFTDRVRRQLTVVLCFSPVGTALRVRARRFPALIQCTTIDWFHPWTSEALQSVSYRFIQEIEGIEVENLKAKLASQEAELTLKKQNIEALITKIGLQTEKVSSKREAADVEAQKVAVIQAEVSIKQKECENDLAKAEPSLTAATAALHTLNKVNLTELKAFPNPPAAVINVTAAVMVLLAPRGRVPKDRSWKAARAFMGKVDDFLQALVSYDKEHIPESCLTVVKQEYLRNPEFHPDLVRTKSTAAAGLCAWTINIVRYYEIYCEVIPKRHALSQANAELETATAKMLAVQKKLMDLDASLQSLTAQFERATAEKISCQEEVTRTNQTIELANRLVKGLESEKERWSQAIVQYHKQQKTLCGDVLITSAFVSYMGYFTRQYRVELLNNSWIPFLQSQKVSVPLTDGLDPILMLTDDATVAAWQNQGLPNDRMSTENAAILTTSERWPLIIDPQQQGIKWIRNRLGSELRVVQLGHGGYLDVIEQALACGETVLIENLPEKVDPVLEHLLGRNTIKRGRYIQIGGKECEYNSNFQLIIHTKLANPHFAPELQAQTTLINFTVTPVGLEEQLLGQVVSCERPDLEALKMELTTQQNHFKIELKRLEDDLLNRLSAAHGNFLGDISLVEQLENTKTTAAHIHCKVVEARENETKINEARELYRPAAERASLLFFIINDLSKINLMYQFSLKTFNSVFNKAMERAEWDEDVRTRVHTLTEAITYSVFLYTSQGLFERDKLTFLSHTAFQTISTMEDFSGLDRDVESSPKRWRKIVESSCPEKERLPQDWKNKSSLQKLIILRALRPDRMTYTLRNFVEESMGTKYVEVARLEFDKLYEDSGPSSPVFFILSPGVNPLKDVEKLDSLLETAAADSHPNYRVFITGEPASCPEQHVIPRGILENAIKITNEPPTGMNASLHAALNNFSQDTLDMCSREQEFNSMFFSLCFFHACVTERRKFGPQGWNHNYPFSTGDLTISASVLYNYLEANIKFEGELSLCPGFLAPPFTDYSGYHSYIDEHLPSENPTLYGLHPNAELECLTVTSDNLLRTLLELQPQDCFGGEGAAQSTEEKVKSVIEDILEMLPEEYNMAEIISKTTKRSPYILVCFQECERMNLLLAEIRKSLNELELGLKSIARKNQWPLDKMTLTVDITKKTKDDFGHPPREGAYIHGLFMEGARWDTQSGIISEAVLRDLTPAMPVLYVRAVPAEELELKNTYECPVYRTKQRGSTYVWTLHLRTKQPPAKWIVAGVAVLLSKSALFSNEIFSNANNRCAALNFSLQPKWLQTDKWRMED